MHMTRCAHAMKQSVVLCTMQGGPCIPLHAKTLQQKPRRRNKSWLAPEHKTLENNPNASVPTLTAQLLKLCSCSRAPKRYLIGRQVRDAERAPPLTQNPSAGP